MDMQNRVGSKFGGGGVMNDQQSARDRKGESVRGTWLPGGGTWKGEGGNLEALGYHAWVPYMGEHLY